MADKKKKVFAPKVRKYYLPNVLFCHQPQAKELVMKIIYLQDPVTPRRPVILKSDREAPKEVPKEKQEIQPTIILKTREQSAPKEERPQSPKTLKTQSSETDGPHISKIAQNENKEKKTIGKIVCVLLLFFIT